MEENVENYFIVFLLGLGSMIAFHNLIISIRKYFTRNYGKVSDMLRIICNYGNLWRFLLSLGYFMTPSDVTPGPCKALGYLYLIGYHLFHISLFSFLLWSIYRLSSEKKDLWLGIAFLLIQTSLVVPELVLAIPQMSLRPTNLNKLLPSRYCDLIFGTNYYRIWTTIIFGFVIMFYLVARISYLAKNRRRCTIANVPSSKSAISDENNTTTTTTTTTTIVAAKRPINLSTIYWSLALTFLTFMLMWLSSSLDEKPDKILLLSRDHSIIGLTYKNLLYILISYVITHLDIEKRKDIIFYNCGGNGRDGGENVRNSSNKLDGEAWVICSKKEKKKDNTGEAENNETQV
ncbi:hypothetical protein RhiirA5_349553 [Rhizophagus irregularis]|uniref:Uncharacterized protein n=2 Tax=Rhizophagus irregularis TaxID=588596 RepID=A0A2I1E304_9GLOM|nr:hypothetical protein RhiirA5_349553 [Rhizophagus irregularis]PKY16469.1 hypothetical protein RhiirB3_521195 [Rhizophagus irregularis]